MSKKGYWAYIWARRFEAFWGADEVGAIIFRKRLQRRRLLSFLHDPQRCVVTMEASETTHHIGCFCQEHGQEPRLMSPLYVRTYAKFHKNNDRDAKAFAEAVTRPTMSHVATKSKEQFDLHPFHRARRRHVTERTRPTNQGRGFLMESGVPVGAGRHVFQKELTRLSVEGNADLSAHIMQMLADMAPECL